MRIGEARSALRLLAVGALLCLCLVPAGCGDSDSSGEEARPDPDAAREAREERENREVAKELENGDFVHCSRKVYANEQSLCTFAEYIEESYYTEIVAGPGKPIGFHPPAEQDYRVFCSGTVPHKCTGFKDDGAGIEPLEGAVIFFSP
ncbi:MAG TPA: hypothetical protein VFR75_09910 [Solirubrobacterales bacterium]|nr:hypothetical protein [Solirubrobacterales bacterium]